MKRIVFLIFFIQLLTAQKPVDYVNPLIGTSNYGAAYPGPVYPRGMASVSPFNVAGKQNVFEKDSQWLSNPYVCENTFLTGFSHVNLSGVGCPDLGVILLMPTNGKLETDHLQYGSTYSEEIAKTGYYSNRLDKYNIKTEMTASKRVGVSRYTFPQGESHILLNLGLGLTNEQGAMVHIVSPTEVEGMRSVGSFCYNSPEKAYPVFFVARFSRPAEELGVWKTPDRYEGVEAQWMGYNGKTRLMDGATQMVVGDSIGTYFTYQFDEETDVEVKIGISYVSIENALENLKKEVGRKSFEQLYKESVSAWNEVLSRIEVEGGTEEDKTIFYTALYHTQIHPNTLNDYNGEYPKINRSEIGKTQETRYTVFSLWDTYRNLHQLLSLVYPTQQSDMVKSMLDMADENGWLPKWELNSTETFTMVGDPASIVIADTYLKGIQDFDVEMGYRAMLKSADQIEGNPLRPGLRDYIQKGYLTTNHKGSVSTTLEYNAADFAISRMADALGKKSDHNRFSKRSQSYKKLFDSKLNLMRPRNSDESWYEPFDPYAGANFTKNEGFIEGNAFQYSFMASHDIPGLIDLMGGGEPFVSQLQQVFDNNQFDMANEPDIAYPYLFNYIKGEEWQTQKTVRQLVLKYFQNIPKGLPGNDDTGTMSAWLIFSMMGLYPVIPGEPVYTLSAPMFDKVTIQLDRKYYHNKKIVINRTGAKDGFIKKIELNGKAYESYFINHEDLVNGKIIDFVLE